jgi:hypothetical protein
LFDEDDEIGARDYYQESISIVGSNYKNKKVERKNATEYGGDVTVWEHRTYTFRVSVGFGTNGGDHWIVGI